MIKKRMKKDKTLTRTLLKEYLNREIDMLRLELTNPEVVLAQLLKSKKKNLEEHAKNKAQLAEQTKICQVEYRDLTNLQALAQRTHIQQGTWAKEQQEYIVAYNKYQTLEETYKQLQKEASDLDTLIMCASDTLQSLLKLRKHQDHVLTRTFEGTYGSEKEADIECHVDKLKEFKRNVLATRSQWDAGMTYIKHANEQFWKASCIWAGVLKQNSPHVRMQQCQAVQNYLGAALKNVEYALHAMKGHTQVPYFTDKLMSEIRVSQRSVYSACVPHYHAQYYEWLIHYQQNAAYLQQWIDKTLEQTIEGDVIKVNGYLAIAETELREERKSLILEKVKEKFGDEAESEVTEQDEMCKKLTAELKAMHSVAIKTIEIHSIDNEAKIKDSAPDDVPVPKSSPPSQEELLTRASNQKIAEDAHAAAEAEAAEIEAKAKEAVRVAEEQAAEKAAAEAKAVAKAEEEAVAALAEEASRKKAEEARAAAAAAAVVAAAAAEEERIREEKNRAEAEKAEAEAEEKRRVEAEAIAAGIAADLAAADAAEDLKDAAVAEAEEAAARAAAAKADVLKWEEMARFAEEKAKKEMEEAAEAAEARMYAELAAAAAEKELEQAEEASARAKEEANAAKEAQKVKDEELERVEGLAREAERERKQKEEEAALKSANPDKPDEAEVTMTFQTDVDSIMNDYRASVEQYEKKRGVEAGRQDLDLQDKLRERRKRRRQQMKQKIQEQKMAADQSQSMIVVNEA